jgi:hypothetical protein
MMKLITIFAVLSASLAVALGYATTELRLYTVWVVLLGLLWAAGIWFGGGQTTGFVTFVAVAAYGLHLQVAVVWMLVGLVAALIGWDLARFQRRLDSQVDSPVETSQLKTIHLSRLATVSGLGLLLGAASLALQIDLTLGWAVLLGLLMAVSLSWVVRRIRSPQP